MGTESISAEALQLVLSELVELRREERPGGEYEPSGGRKVADWRELTRRCRELLDEGTQDLRVLGYWFEGLAGSGSVGGDLAEENERGLTAAFDHAVNLLRRSPESWIPADEEGLDFEAGRLALEFLDRTVSRWPTPGELPTELRTHFDAVEELFSEELLPGGFRFDARARLAFESVPAPEPSPQSTALMQPIEAAALVSIPATTSARNSNSASGQRDLRTEARRLARDQFDADPYAALSYRITRAVAWETVAPVFRLPSIEARQRIETLFVEEQWRQLVIETEMLLWGETPWWLEGQWFAVEALSKLGERWQEVLEEVSGGLTTLLDRVPELRTARFDDGTRLLTPKLEFSHAKRCNTGTLESLPKVDADQEGLRARIARTVQDQGTDAAMRVLLEHPLELGRTAAGFEWGVALAETYLSANSRLLAAAVFCRLKVVADDRGLWEWIEPGCRALVVRRCIELEDLKGEAQNNDLQRLAIHAPFEALQLRGET